MSLPKKTTLSPETLKALRIQANLMRLKMKLDYTSPNVEEFDFKELCAAATVAVDGIEDTAKLERCATASQLRDVARRIGVAASPEWVKWELERLAAHFKQCECKAELTITKDNVRTIQSTKDEWEKFSKKLEAEIAELRRLSVYEKTTVEERADDIMIDWVNRRLVREGIVSHLTQAVAEAVAAAYEDAAKIADEEADIDRGYCCLEENSLICRLIAKLIRERAVKPQEDEPPTVIGRIISDGLREP